MFFLKQGVYFIFQQSCKMIMQKSTRIAEISTKATGLHFNALHWMQGGLVTRKLSVYLYICLSVRPSVKRMHCDKTEERYSRFLYRSKDHLAEFSQKNDGWSEMTPSTCNFRSKWPHWSEMAKMHVVLFSVDICS